MVVLIFGIIWIIKGEIKIRKSPWWDERRISASNGRFLGTTMVIGSLCPLCVPLSQEVGVIWTRVVAILPIALGIVMSEEVNSV
jgi:hypothetical protein